MTCGEFRDALSRAERAELEDAFLSNRGGFTMFELDWFDSEPEELFAEWV